MRQSDKLARIRQISVANGVSRWQKVAMRSAILLFLGFILISLQGALSTLVLALIVMFAAVCAIKAIVVFRGSAGVLSCEVEVSDQESPAIAVMVPMYHESRVLRQLVASLSQMDYPAHLFSVILLLEEDDEETVGAAMAMDLPDNFEIVVVPTTYNVEVRSKPRALEYVRLERSELLRGKIVGIYDAEDHPEVDQLRKVASAMTDPGVSAVQAELRWHNAMQASPAAWKIQLHRRTAIGKAFEFMLKAITVPIRMVIAKSVTACIAISYAMHYRGDLPGLVATNGVVPLGGTSNFIRWEVLSAVGGWDPGHVAEDQDLGCKMARAGYRSWMIPSVTWEEALESPMAQIFQSSRWTKGGIATTMSHTRDLGYFFRDYGWWKSTTFLTMVTASHPAAMVAPLFWMMTITFAVTQTALVQQVTPAPAFYLGSICLLANFYFIMRGLFSALSSDQPRLVLYLPLMPLYWAVVGSGAAMMAAKDVATGKLSYWRKTPHGLIESRPVGVVSSRVSAPVSTEQEAAELSGPLLKGF